MTNPETPNQPTERLYLQVLLQDTVPAQAIFDTRADISCVSQETLREQPNLEQPSPDQQRQLLGRGASRAPLIKH